MPGSQQKTSCQPACLHRKGLSSKFHNVACKKQLKRVPRSVQNSNVLRFAMHQPVVAAQQTLWFCLKLPPSPVSAAAGDCSRWDHGALVCSSSFPACQSFDRSLLGLARRISVLQSWPGIIKARFFRADLLPFHAWVMTSRGTESMAEEETVF